MKTIVIAVSTRAVNARRVPRRTGLQAVAGVEPSPAWQGCGVSCCATKHNGLFGKVTAVTALKLRLVRLPLRPRALRPSGLPNPRYVLRPLPCARGTSLTACSAKPHAGQPLASVPVPAAPAQVFWSGAARGLWCWPRPPVVGQALCAFGPRRVRPVRPQGAPSCPARRWVGCLRCLVACLGHNRQNPTACTALRAVLQPWRTNPIPLEGRGCSSGARQ